MINNSVDILFEIFSFVLAGNSVNIVFDISLIVKGCVLFVSEISLVKNNSVDNVFEISLVKEDNSDDILFVISWVKVNFVLNVFDISLVLGNGVDILFEISLLIDVSVDWLDISVVNNNSVDISLIPSVLYVSEIVLLIWSESFKIFVEISFEFETIVLVFLSSVWVKELSDKSELSSVDGIELLSFDDGSISSVDSLLVELKVVFCWFSDSLLISSDAVLVIVSELSVFNIVDIEVLSLFESLIIGLDDIYVEDSSEILSEEPKLSLLFILLFEFVGLKIVSELKSLDEISEDSCKCLFGKEEKSILYSFFIIGSFSLINLIKSSLS